VDDPERIEAANGRIERYEHAAVEIGGERQMSVGDRQPRGPTVFPR